MGHPPTPLRLKAFLKDKLYECGWRDQLKEHCKGKAPHMLAGRYTDWLAHAGAGRGGCFPAVILVVGQPVKVCEVIMPPVCLFPEVIRNKGLEKITVDELVAEITPHGRGEHWGWMHDTALEMS